MKNKLYILSSAIFFSACSSHQLSSIQDFKQIDNNLTVSSQIWQDKNIIKSDKWQIYLISQNKHDKNHLINILKNINQIEIVSDINNSNTDFILESFVEQENFDGQILLNGIIKIKYSNYEQIEEQIPFSQWDELENEFKKLFSSQKGYILEKRINRDGDSIFKISLGKKHNIKVGDSVGIYNIKNRVSFLQNKSQNQLSKIGVGKVAYLTNNYSWIVAFKNITNQISLGSIVKLNRERDFGNYLEDGTDFFKINDEVLDRKIKFLLPFGE